MSEPTEQRLTLAVPTPATSMNLGKSWATEDWTSDGFCVNTDARVWLAADGANEKQSTLALLSNGGSGQLLLQSIQKNLWIYSKERTVLGSNETLFLGGTESVKILGGWGVSMAASIAWDFHDASGDAVGPDATDPSSDTALEFINGLSGIGDAWAITDVASNVLAITLEILRAVFGVKGSGTSASTASTVAAIRATTNSIGNLVNTSQLYSDGVPGIHVYSWGSINIASPLFVSMYSMAGMTSFGGAINDYAFLDGHVIGGAAATFKSLCYAGIEASEISVSATLDVEGSARTGDWKMYAANIHVGAKGGEAASQVPTLSTTFEAFNKITLEQPVTIELDAGGNVEVESGTIDGDGKLKVVIKNPSYTVTLSSTGVNIQLAKISKVDLGKTAAVLSVGTEMTMQADSGAVELALPTCGISCDAGGAWSWSAAQVVFL